MAKVYPVKFYYTRHPATGVPKYRKDIYQAELDALALSATHKQDITIWVVEVPRTNSTAISLALLAGDFTTFRVERARTIRYSKPHTPPPPPKQEGPFDPYKWLEIEPLSITRQALRAAFVAASKRHHPDLGGSHEAMQKTNRANDMIKMAKGWN